MKEKLYIKPDYRKYFMDAVVQQLDILRNSAHEEEKLCIKPDYRKYFPGAVVQKLDILRNSAHEGETLYKTTLPLIFPGCCGTEA